MILHLNFKNTDLFLKTIQFCTTFHDHQGVVSVYDIQEDLREELNKGIPSGYTYRIMYKHSSGRGVGICGLEMHCSSESEALMFKLSTQYPFHGGPLNA